MKKALDLLAKTLEFLVIALGMALIVIVIVQIMGRIIGASVSWTEELSRYVMVGIVAFASPLVARRDQFIRVDVLINKLPRKTQQIWILTLDLLVAIFLLIMAYNAISYVQVGALQKSSVLRIPMSYLFATVLIGPALTAVFFLEKVAKALFTLRKESEQ